MDCDYCMPIDIYKRVRKSLNHMSNPRWAVWDYLEEEYGLKQAFLGRIYYFKVTDKTLLVAFLLRWS